jgi:hypothetical protein
MYKLCIIMPGIQQPLHSIAIHCNDTTTLVKNYTKHHRHVKRSGDSHDAFNEAGGLGNCTVFAPEKSDF